MGWTQDQAHVDSRQRVIHVNNEVGKNLCKLHVNFISPVNNIFLTAENFPVH